MSKHQLLWTWPDPLTVCDIASLIGFAIFYSNLIPHFEVRTKRVHDITKLAYLGPVAPHFNKAARLSRRILSVMISDQCMIWFDHRKCLYLRTDISALNFGYASTQLTDDKESLLAMRREMAEAPFEFIGIGSKLKVHIEGFGSQRTRGNETRLHLHLCWGMRFT